MVQDIYDPLDEFAKVFREKFRKIAEETFQQIAKEANIDVSSNQETCKLLYQTQDEQSSIRSRLSGGKFLCAVLWIIVAVAILLIF